MSILSEVILLVTNQVMLIISIVVFLVILVSLLVILLVAKNHGHLSASGVFLGLVLFLVGFGASSLLIYYSYCADPIFHGA